MKIYNSLIVCLLILIFVSYSSSSYLFGSTYDFNETRKNYFAHINPTTGQLIQKKLYGNEVFQVTETACKNNKNGNSIFILEGKKLVTINPKNLIESQSHVYLQNELSSMEYDNKEDKLYAIFQLYDNRFSEINPKTGEAKLLFYFEDTIATFLGGSSFDSKNSRYFFLGEKYYENKTKDVGIFVANMKKQKIDQFISLPCLFDGLEYDPVDDVIYGLSNGTFWRIDVKTNKIDPILKLTRPGILTLWGSTIDFIKGKYYAHIIHFEEKIWVEIDYRNKKINEKNVKDNLRLLRVIH